MITLSLLQIGESQAQVLYIILGVITLAVIIALGGPFAKSLFYVVTAPQASLGHYGKRDNFFFSLFIVFLGGLIGTFALLYNSVELSSSFHTFSVEIANDIAQGNPSDIYRDAARDWGVEIMDRKFDLYVIQNIVFFPIVMGLLWFITGTLVFLLAKMFGSGSSYSALLGAVAYAGLFSSIGWGLLLAGSGKMLSAYATQGAPVPGVFGIIGIVFLIYSIVLFVMAVGQGAELSSTQSVILIIILMLLIGGISYGIFYMLQEPMDSFVREIKSYNPGK
jgi:hypothetical protein